MRDVAGWHALSLRRVWALARRQPRPSLSVRACHPGRHLCFELGVHRDCGVQET